MVSNNKRFQLVLLFLGTTVVTTTVSFKAEAEETLTQEEIRKISENWVCKWCPYPQQTDSSAGLTAGAGYISNDSYKQGDYTGRDEKGAYLIGDFSYAHQSPEYTYADVKGTELGTDARDLSVEARTRGKLSGSFSYSELPKLNLDTARTPYSGGTNQQLPTGWTSGGTTQAMPQLANALHNVDIYTQRKTFSLAAKYQQNASVSYAVEFQRDTKDGSRTAGLALGNSFAVARSAILAIPVDYVTDTGELKVNYIRQRWHTSIAYQFSNFDNYDNSIRWENAFSAPAATPEGQAALEPDNTMQKLLLTGAYRISPDTSSNGMIAYGQMKQNAAFLPYTINGSLSPFALPASSLNGVINTLDATVNLNSRITKQFRVEAKYLYNEQDNTTSRNSYDYIVADTSPAGSARANFPYSFRKSHYQLAGRYYLANHNVSLGIKREDFDRTYQEVETTTENTLYAHYHTSVIERVDVQIRGAHSERDGNHYQAVTEIQPPENVLMRKYNFADRDRNQLGITASYSPRSSWQLSAYFDAYKDLYSKSDIGLLESIQKDYGIALRFPASTTVSLNVDYALSTIESTQAGSQSFSLATWHAVNDDQIDVIRLEINYAVIPKTANIGVEYSYARSTGDIKVSTGAPLPALTSTRHTIALRGDYRLNNASKLVGFYRYEDYDEKDWATDNVNTNSIDNVLSLGEVSPSYRIGILGIAFNHNF